MYRRKQSVYDRLLRLSEGRCPIHGLQMYQTGLSADGTAYIVSCTRQDCGFSGLTHEPFGPCVPMPEGENEWIKP